MVATAHSAANSQAPLRTMIRRIRNEMTTTSIHQICQVQPKLKTKTTQFSFDYKLRRRPPFPQRRKKRRKISTYVSLFYVSCFTPFYVSYSSRKYSRDDRNVECNTQIIDFFHFSAIAKQIARFTVFENDRKSLIQHCERSELRLQFEWTTVN